MENRTSVEWRYQKGEKYVYNRMQFHPYLEIYYFLDGNAEYVSRDMRCRLKSRQAVIIPPGEYHFVNVLGDKENYTRCVMNIWPDFTDGDTFGMLASKSGPLPERGGKIGDCFDFLIDMQGKMSEEDFSDLLSCVAREIIYSVKYDDSIKPRGNSGDDTVGKKIIMYIDDNLLQDISLESIAEALNYSVSHISHVFRESYGISVRDYIVGKRLSLARNSILSGEKVQNACMKSGFSDYSSFFRLYKKAFGVSPSKDRSH